MSPKPECPQGPQPLLAAVIGLGVALRLLAIPEQATTYDEIDFLESLTRYDLAAHAPHFPGYPAYVLAARIAAALGAPPLLALALPGIALSIPATICLAAHVRTLAEPTSARAAAMIVALLLALSPLSVLEAGRPMSDAPAAALATLSLALLLGPHQALGAFCLGLLPGLKADHLLLVPWLLLSIHRRRAALAFAFGLAIWLIPFLFVVGLGPLSEEGAPFLRGHMTIWGGTALSPGSPPLLLRPLLAALALLAALGFPGALGLSLLGLCWGPRASISGEGRLLAASAPMIAWVLFGQNLAEPRHLLALVGPAVLFIAPRIARAPAAPCIVAAFFIGSGLSLGQHLRPIARNPEFVLAAVALAPTLQSQARHRLYAGASIRSLRRALPDADIRRARTLALALADLDSDPSPPRRIFITTELGPIPLALRRATLFSTDLGAGLEIYELTVAPPPPLLPLPGEPP